MGFLICHVQAVPSGDEREGLKHPGLMLKYSTYKNLAQLAAQRDDFETAMEFYLEVQDLFLSRKSAPPASPVVEDGAERRAVCFAIFNHGVFSPYECPVVAFLP